MLSVAFYYDNHLMETRTLPGNQVPRKGDRVRFSNHGGCSKVSAVVWQYSQMLPTSVDVYLTDRE